MVFPGDHRSSKPDTTTGLLKIFPKTKARGGSGLWSAPECLSGKSDSGHTTPQKVDAISSLSTQSFGRDLHQKLSMSTVPDARVLRCERDRLQGDMMQRPCRCSRRQAERCPTQKAYEELSSISIGYTSHSCRSGAVKLETALHTGHQ